MIHSTETTSTASEPASPAGRPSSLLDKGTAVILLSTAIVAGTLSARGAHAMFSGNWLMALTFAVVVQITISVTLWEMPRQSLRTKLVLVPAWCVAIGFSIGSAYYSSYQANSAERVAALKGEVVNTLAETASSIDQLEEQARRMEARAADEDTNGTFSKGVPGRKQKWRELHEQAVDLRSRSDQAQSARDALAAARAQIQVEDLNLEDIRNIYDGVVVAAGRYMTGVRPPNFSREQQGFAVVVWSAYRIVFGLNNDATREERSRVIGSVLSSSIMELLALLASLIRAAAFESRRRSVAEWLAFPAALVLTLKYLPEELRARATRLHSRSIDAADRRQDRLEYTQERLTDPTPAIFDAEWEAQARAQSKALGRKNLPRLVREVLPREAALRRILAGGVAVSTTALFDASGFYGKNIMLNGAFATRVLVVGSRGELAPGDRWDRWIRCMLRLLSKEESSISTGGARARPDLKVVGANVKRVR